MKSTRRCALPPLQFFLQTLALASPRLTQALQCLVQQLSCTYMVVDFLRGNGRVQ
jgi:hypothetical protein